MWANPRETPEPPPHFPNGRRPYSVRDITIQKAIGADVRRIRESAGLTEADLANRIARTQPFVHKLEHGVGAISLPTLFDIADVLGVPPQHFLDVARDAAEAEKGRHMRRQRRKASPRDMGRQREAE